MSTADFTDVDVVALAADAARRLDWGARRVELPAGRYETVLPPSAVADLMIYLAWSMDGRPAQEGRSALAGPDGPRTGERLTTLPLTLTCDPAAPGLEYEPFLHRPGPASGISVFDNGAPTRRVDWVRDGVIGRAGLLPGRGRRVRHHVHPAGGQPAAHRRVRGLDRRTWWPSTERGLLLTCLWYIRVVDPATLLLTGLTRDGVYLVEGGEVVGEVEHNFRFNYSPLDVLRRTTEVGATERTLPREMDGLVHPDRDAAGAGAGVQHVVGLAGPLIVGAVRGSIVGAVSLALRASGLRGPAPEDRYPPRPHARRRRRPAHGRSESARRGVRRSPVRCRSLRYAGVAAGEREGPAVSYEVVSAYTLLVGDVDGSPTVSVHTTADDAWRALDAAIRERCGMRPRPRRRDGRRRDHPAGQRLAGRRPGVPLLEPDRAPAPGAGAGDRPAAAGAGPLTAAPGPVPAADPARPGRRHRPGTRPVDGGAPGHRAGARAALVAHPRPPFQPGGEVSWVAPARDPAGRDLVLKVAGGTRTASTRRPACEPGGTAVPSGCTTSTGGTQRRVAARTLPARHRAVGVALRT